MSHFCEALGFRLRNQAWDFFESPAYLCEGINTLHGGKRSCSTTCSACLRAPTEILQGGLQICLSAGYERHVHPNKLGVGYS